MVIIKYHKTSTQFVLEVQIVSRKNQMAAQGKAFTHIQLYFLFSSDVLNIILEFCRVITSTQFMPVPCTVYYDKILTEF